MEAGSNYYYLSGLLIGTELRECAANKSLPITLVAAGEIRQLYLSAFKAIGLKENIRTIDSTLALIRGQLSLLKQYV